jgi:hypothetical protein
MKISNEWLDLSIHIWSWYEYCHFRVERRCHNLSLGFVTKVRAWKGVGRECNPIVTFTLPRMPESVREWAHTLPSGLPLWELESLWSPKLLESNYKGQNSLDWRLHCTNRDILRCKCLKWAYIIHLSTYNTSYGWKKGRKSKCQFDSRPLKVKNHLKFHVCRWRATYH